MVLRNSLFTVTSKTCNPDILCSSIIWGGQEQMEHQLQVLLTMGGCQNPPASEFATAGAALHCLACSPTQQYTKGPASPHSQHRRRLELNSLWGYK